MLPGPIIIIECPHCKQLAKQRALLSGNTYGSVLWSDGKRVCPMLHCQPQITKCKSCNKFYFLKDAEEVAQAELHFLKQNEILEDLSYIEFLSPDEYLEAVSSPVCKNLKDEIYLRTQFWWLFNDLYRHSTPPLKSRKVITTAIETYKDKNLDNILKLIEIIPEKEKEFMLMKAELYREISEFDNCIALLAKVPKKYEKFTLQIKIEAEKANPNVIVLDEKNVDKEYIIADPRNKIWM